MSYFFHLEKVKKQNEFLWKSQKILKGPPFYCQKRVDQRYWWRSRTSWEILISIKIFDNSHLKFGKRKLAKVKKKHFWRPFNCKRNFFTNWICYLQIKFIKNSNKKFLCFLKGRYFLIGGPIDVKYKCCCVWRYLPMTFLAFPRRVVLQLIPKYSESYVNLNVKCRP